MHSKAIFMQSKEFMAIKQRNEKNVYTLYSLLQSYFHPPENLITSSRFIIMMDATILSAGTRTQKQLDQYKLKQYLFYMRENKIRMFLIWILLLKLV